MFKVLANAWKIADLRKKMLFTLFILVLFRLGCAIPVPFLDNKALADMFSQYTANGHIFGYLNVLAGGALQSATIFSLSISPYINASIIMQLLMIAIPAFERKMKEDPQAGQKIMTRGTRYLTLLFSLLLGFGYYTILRNSMDVVAFKGESSEVFAAIVIILAFAAGASVIMWMGEKINEKGIGNGISMILFAGIVSQAPQMIMTGYAYVAGNNYKWTNCVVLLGIVAAMIVMIAFVVFITHGERRIPVQYAKKVVGRKMYGGQNTHIPLKVNMTGVMPIIFAQSFVMLPSTIVSFFPGLEKTWFGSITAVSGGWLYALCMFLLIIGFSYFYTMITFSPIEVANNLKKNGGFIMGIRPGRPTSEFISKTLNRITLLGAIFLGLIAAIPAIASAVIPTLSALAVGGTSVIIVVGVALEFVQQLESQMVMRHYKGFLE
ncbi:MAG: preprotein translocase subunit SecY [Clostridia bacterium]|nr:preprotein translocase subunit SecY [Clostridia bacterium]